MSAWECVRAHVVWGSAGETVFQNFGDGFITCDFMFKNLLLHFICFSVWFGLVCYYLFFFLSRHVAERTRGVDVDLCGQFSRNLSHWNNCSRIESHKSFARCCSTYVWMFFIIFCSSSLLFLMCQNACYSWML